ncbi:MAG: ABC-2 transporter permease [Lachnospiraceae bacterium]
MMKGLFIKDLRLLKGQKQFFAAVLLMMAIFMGTYTNFSFVISYITMMVGVLTLTTISYDDFENGLGYIFTLPVSRRDYVGEKYLFSVVTTLPGLAAVSILSFVVSGIRKIDFLPGEWVASAVAGFLLVTMMLSVLIPLQLKFGVDKSRVAMMLVMGGIVLIIYVGTKVCDALGIDWIRAVNILDELSPAVSLLGAAAICGIVMVISYLVSLHVIEKREF